MPVLANLGSRTAVAELLGTTERQLRYLLYARPEAQRYTAFKIPKRRGGERIIEAPRPDLRLLQQRFLEVLQEVYDSPSCVHGFTKGRSIVTGASPHCGRRYVFNVDIRRFFPSINFGRVLGLFESDPLKIPRAGAVCLAQLCCHRNALPQGAPTSPIISNMICRRLDRQLTRIARVYYCTYTRYADDITISKRRGVFPQEIGYINDDGVSCVGKRIRDVLGSNGFEINTEKVRLQTNTDRQMVTGVTVNAKPNIKRQSIRQIRAMIHAWEKYGREAADADHATKFYRRRWRRGGIPSIQSVIRGKLDFVKMVRGAGDPVYRNLQRQFVKVCPQYLAVMKEENRQMDSRDVFISHASEDKDEIARPLAEALVAAGFTVWFDEYEIEWGDNLRRKIDAGLANARFGIVVLSTAFASKEWTNKELDGLTAIEDAQERKVVLPIWHRLSDKDVVTYFPMLAGKWALRTDKCSINQIVDTFAKVARP